MSEPRIDPAFIAVGSNIQPEVHIPKAISQLHGLGHLRAISRVYQSKPVGGRMQSDFMNAAALVLLSEQPAALRMLLRKIEDDLGRTRTEDKYASRTIDLDLVIYGDRVDPDYPLPDPEILTMEHLAVPLADLAPEFCHPTTGEALGAIALRLQSGELVLHTKLSQRVQDVLTDGGQAASGD